MMFVNKYLSNKVLHIICKPTQNDKKKGECGDKLPECGDEQPLYCDRPSTKCRIFANRENFGCMKRNRIALYIDLLFCLVIIPLAIMLLPVDRWIANDTGILISLISYVYTLYFVYRLICLPKLFMQKKYLHIAILLIILVSITVLLTYLPIPNNHPNDSAEQIIIRKNIRRQTIWFFFLIVTGFSLAIELTFELFRQILSLQAVEAEKNKAELALYKAQINPHFLFNTLNTLYALVLSGSDKTESAFIKFSGILRYMYSQSDFELIPVERELDYIQQYVDLQKLRLNHHTQVNLSLEASNKQILIPPMILITFIENVFKYGTSSDTDCSAHISIRVNEERLTLETENSVMRRREDGICSIGIANCRKRLDLLYPNRYELRTEETDGKYTVFLNIQLK